MSFLDRFKKKKTEDKKEKSELKLKEKKAKPVKEKETKEYSTLQAKAETGMPAAPVKVKEGKTTKRKKEDTKDAYKVLIRPLVTEKATDLAVLNKYCFEVAQNANKIEIKKAIKSLYGLEPVDIKIINLRGKRIRYGRVSGKKKNWKKAIITLKQGDKIEIYEGV